MMVFPVKSIVFRPVLRFLSPSGGGGGPFVFKPGMRFYGAVAVCKWNKFPKLFFKKTIYNIFR